MACTPARWLARGLYGQKIWLRLVASPRRHQRVLDRARPRAEQRQATIVVRQGSRDADQTVVAVSPDRVDRVEKERPFERALVEPMDREHGAREACAFIKRADFKPSNVAFDAAFDD